MDYVKEGTPSDEVLEELAEEIGAAWKKLGRRLKFKEAALTGFHKQHEEYSEKAYHMLLTWKREHGPQALYQVIYEALCHHLVGRTDLASKFCCDEGFSLEDFSEKELGSKGKGKRSSSSTDMDQTLKRLRLMTGTEKAILVFHYLQKPRVDANQNSKEVDLLKDLRQNARIDGFIISNNPGGGNCMFYALAEQLRQVKGISISHGELRRRLVAFLQSNPKLASTGTDLYSFVAGYSSWSDYLKDMGKDRTWGDHVVLVAAANCFQVPIRIISSLPDRPNIAIGPESPVDITNPLVLGHVHELHYVSLLPEQGFQGGFQRGEHVTCPSGTESQPHNAGFQRGEHVSSPSETESQPHNAGFQRGEHVSSPSGTESQPHNAASRVYQTSTVKERIPFSPAASTWHLPRGDKCVTGNGKGYDHETLVELLKDEYNRRSWLKPLLWDPSIHLSLESVYTRLQIKSRKKTDFGLTDNEVRMYDIFKPDRNSEYFLKSVLAEGQPGSGKTTFCLKLAHDWGNNRIPKEHCFPEFELVLLLKCRDMDGDVMQAIYTQLLPEDMSDEEKTAIMNYIKDMRHQNKMLVILDGLDELPEKAKKHVDKLLNRKILSRCFMLATTRQERGIEVRKNFVFDILLEIKGFTEKEAFEYIGKHFRSLDAEKLSRGERLIHEIQENKFLRALRDNPLNLLLLCVVFEDYEGELPATRSELYQIIFRCLLRRFCAKTGREAPDDDQLLERQFDSSVRVLGELAWKCLREDRLYFVEAELKELETNVEEMVALKMGFVSKEASARKLKPQHRFNFSHKSFQEFFAALYLAHKLRNAKTNVYVEFRLTKDDFISKYKQVFLFVAGILETEATVHFIQMGKCLQEWHLPQFHDSDYDFLSESLNESRNAEEMALAICSFISLPRMTETSPGTPRHLDVVLQLLGAYEHTEEKGKLPQQPVHLKVMNASHLDDVNSNTLGKVLRESSRLESLYLSTDIMTDPLATTVLEGLSTNTSLSSLTLEIFQGISDAVAVDVGNSLRGITTLATLTLKLHEESSDAWASVIERALTRDTPLTSVRLEIFGRMSDTGAGGLRKILLNNSLSSLNLIIHEGMTDALVAAISEGLTGEPFLKHFSLIVHGELSNSDAISLRRGFQENKTLLSLSVRIFGKVPNSWVTVVDNILSKRKTLQCFAIHPNVYGNIAASQVANLSHFHSKDSSLSKLSLTLNVWGELSFDGAEALREFIPQGAPSTSLTLNINGNVGDTVADSLTRNLIANKFLSFLTIDIRGVLSSSGRIALEGLSTNSQIDSFTLNVHDPMTDDLENLGSKDSLFVSSTSAFLCIDGSGTSIDELEKVSLQCESSVKLSIVINDDAARDWGPRLGKGLAKCKALTTLSVTITCHSDMSENWGYHLWSGLAGCKALTTLSVTITSYSDMSEDWGLGLLSGLSECKALTTLSVMITSYGGMSGDWGVGLLSGLTECKALTTLSVTITSHSDMSGDWGVGLLNGLSGCKALTTLSVTITSHSDMSEVWGVGLLIGLSECKALTTLSVTITSHSDMSEDWGVGLLIGLSGCESLTTLNVTITIHSDMSGAWGVGLLSDLSGCKALTTFNLTITCHSDMSGDWGVGLLSDLSGCKALTILSVTITSHSDMSGDWGVGLLRGLTGCKALTTLSVTITSHSDMSEDWEYGLLSDLTGCNALTTLSVTITCHSDMSEDWGYGLLSGLTGCKALTTLSVTIISYSGMSGDWGRGLKSGLTELCKSLATLNLTVSLYGEENT